MRLRTSASYGCVVSYLCLHIVVQGHGHAASADSRCPCDDESWCETIGGPPTRPKEVFGFYGSWVRKDTGVRPGQDMNWTHVTTVAWADEDEVMCLAHQHGARAVIGPPKFDLMSLATEAARADWIENALSLVQSRFRDGIVFDYEEPQPEGSIGGAIYAALVAETREAFHKANPSLQVSTCVPWSPDNIDGRGYPYGALADGSDLLYVMDYDTRSQIFDACLAGANAPYPGMIRGMQRWFDLGIPPSKLVLGVPWYGYRYPCLPGTSPDAIYCPLKQVAFRGVNCSDAAGVEVAYSHIQQVLTSGNTAGNLRRDSNTLAPFFNTFVNGTVFQYWFDDPVSLRAKFRWANQNDLRGVGPFVFRYLDPIHAADDAIAMWSTFDEFLSNNQGSSGRKIARSLARPSPGRRTQTEETLGV